MSPYLATVPRTWPAQTGRMRPGLTEMARTSARPTGVRRRRRFRLRWRGSRFLVRWSRLPGLRTLRPPCRLLPPTSMPQTGRLLTGALPSRPPLSRARQTGWPQRRAPLSRPDRTRPPQVRVLPMRVCLVGLLRTRVPPMGAHQSEARPMRVCLVRLVGVLLMGARRVGLPRCRCLGSGGPRRLLCRRCLQSRRWLRPAHSGLPRPRSPSNQPNRSSRTSRAGRPSQVSHPNRANRVSRFSRAGLAGRVGRAIRAIRAIRVSLVGRPSRGSRFSLVGLVRRVGVLLGWVPRGLTPGLRRPRVCRPARGQERLLPRPARSPSPQLRRHSRRLSAAPPVAPLGTPQVAVLGTRLVVVLVGALLGTHPVAVLVGAVPTPRPGQRRGPRPVRGPVLRPVRRLARPVPPPPVDARRPRPRSRPSWPPPATPSETPS